MTNIEVDISNNFLFDDNLIINEAFVEKLVRFLNKNQKNKLIYDLTIQNPKTIKVIF